MELLDVRCFSRPIFHIARAPVTGWALIPETFRNMIPDKDILLVRCRWGKEPPYVKIAAKKARVQIEVQSRPLMDDILVTVLGPKEKDNNKKQKKETKPKAAPTPKTPKVRCFGATGPGPVAMYQKDPDAQRLRDLLS
jgi:hypothetical protein